MKDSTDHDENKYRDFDEYDKACGGISDPVLLVLRSHLYFEYMLDRIIVATLTRGDRVIEKGRLSFSQKLVLVSSFDSLPDSDITIMKNLNIVRNRCAHERLKEINMADIELIGRPLGKSFTKIRKEEHDNILVCLNRTLVALGGGLSASTNNIEVQGK